MSETQGTTTDVPAQPAHMVVILNNYGGRVEHPRWRDYLISEQGTLQLTDEHGEVLASIAEGQWRAVFDSDADPTPPAPPQVAVPAPPDPWRGQGW